MAIGDLYYIYDELTFQLAVGGNAWPEASSEPYAIKFVPIKYDKTKLKIKELRIESVAHQDYAGTSRYEASVKVKKGTALIDTAVNNLSWSFTDTAQTKANGDTVPVNDNESITIDGTATYNVIPGVAPFTTARCHVNMRIYYVLEATTTGSVDQPTSGGGGTVTPPLNATALLSTVILVGGLAVAGMFAFTALGKEWRPERERAVKTFDDVRSGGGSLSRELGGIGREIKGLFRGLKA